MKALHSLMIDRPPLGWFPLLILLLPMWVRNVAGAEQTQTLTLAPGWNAVWIDPAPTYTDGEAAGQAKTVEDVFTDSRITVVARPLLPAGSAEFVSDSASVFNQEEWLVWYRNPESMVNTLLTVSGNQAYYVQVTGSSAPLSISVTGRVAFHRPDWVPGSYNLLGFNLSAAVAFSDFFGTTGAADGNHPISAILRLDATTGEWTGVQPTDLMQPGVAYWIKSVRQSTFAGPVAIAFSGSDTLAFGSTVPDITIGKPPDAHSLSSQELTFSNVDDTPHPVAVQLVSPNPANDLRLYEVVPDPSSLSYSLGSPDPISTLDIGTLPAHQTRTVTVGAERNWTSGRPSRETLYRIDIGPQFFWLPVTAQNPAVTPTDPTSPNAAFAGLWIGDIQLNQVSRIDGSGPESTTSTATFRLLLLVDDAGAPWMLDHVMFMRTRTADPSVPSQDVLVADESRIPYFEGIETRNGKRVGRRLETVGYDLPRDDDPTVQAGLVPEVAAALDLANTNEVSADDIEAFLKVQTSRPPALTEAYHLRWPLEGALGADAVVRTSTNAPLALDPFHRSNPFRHAFHPRHAAGYPITRSFAIAFESAPIAGRLQGTYVETIEGLAAQPLTVRGSLTLRRISSVTQIQ